MNTKGYRRLGLGVVSLLGLILLVACGDPTVTALPPPAPTSEVVTTTAALATTTTSSRTTNPTTAVTTTSNRATAVVVAGGVGPSLTAQFPERTVIRSFNDLKDRPIKLTYGRGSGRGGDYGWAHIYGKHVQGIWYDGGTITTFPKAVATKTPDEVVDLIDKSLQDKNPDDAGNGRRSYVYAVPGTTKDIFTVVGSDGTIITSYPVPHGSKDEDA